MLPWSSRGTLKSTRIRAFLPRKSFRSLRVFLAIRARRAMQTRALSGGVPRLCQPWLTWPSPTADTAVAHQPRGLLAEFPHTGHQVGGPAAIAPLVVVPAEDLGHGAVPLGRYPGALGV